MGQFDLNAALVLVRVVQAGSFRAAAEQLPPGPREDEVDVVVRQLAHVSGLDMLQRVLEPRVSCLHAGREGIKDPAEAAGRLVGDAVVHVHQAQTKWLGAHETGMLRQVAATSQILAPLW